MLGEAPKFSDRVVTIEQIQSCEDEGAQGGVEVKTAGAETRTK